MELLSFLLVGDFEFSLPPETMDTFNNYYWLSLFFAMV